MAKQQIYWVDWRYPSGEIFRYKVRMTEAQADRTLAFLNRYVESGYLDVVVILPEEDKRTLSIRDLTQIIREEFPRSEKEWAP